MLAVTLGHSDSAVILLQHEANVNTENTQGWSGKLFLFFIYTFIFLTNLFTFIEICEQRLNFIFVIVVQEAVGTGNPELLQLVLARRDYQRYCNRVAGIPELLHKLKQVS